MSDINDLTQNVTIWNDSKTKNITTSSTNGSKERLDISDYVGEADSDNTTTTPLGIDGEYTGTWKDILGYAHISIQVKADVASATDGLQVQWSTDGVNVLDDDKFTIPADTGKVFTFGAQAQYYRLYYKNNDTDAQSTFNLTPILKTRMQKPSSHRVSESISNQDDAELTKAVLTGQDSAGAFQNVQTTPSGLLKVEAAIVAVEGGLPVAVKYDKAFQAVNANEWQEIATYIVPAGYHLIANSFTTISETAGETSRVVSEITGGTFVCSTNTFTDGSAFTAPQFGSGIHLVVTTEIGAALADTITITYTNELGTTGRTCTIVLPKSSLVGTVIEGILEGDDLGIRDITNITHSATGQAGAFSAHIYFPFFYILMSSSNVQYQSVSVAGSPIEFPSSSELSMQVLAGTKTNYIRQLGMVGILIPN